LNAIEVDSMPDYKAGNDRKPVSNATIQIKKDKVKDQPFWLNIPNLRIKII
jgi:hypothetical protein